MNIKALSLLVGLVLSCSLNAAAIPMPQSPTTTPSEPVTLYTDIRKPITVIRQVPDFRIRVPANPTTGYSWMVKSYDDTLVKLTGGSYEPPKSKLIGAGGAMVWNFKLLPAAFDRKKQIEIKLMYVRPWEKTPGRELTVTVAPSN